MLPALATATAPAIDTDTHTHTSTCKYTRTHTRAHTHTSWTFCGQGFQTSGGESAWQGNVHPRARARKGLGLQQQQLWTGVLHHLHARGCSNTVKQTKQP